jgi:osmotically-inducible protein OsmY
MSSYIRKVYGLTSAIILIGAIAGCATAPGDAEETANVRAGLAQHAELGAPNSIDVQTVDHVVYLNGLVSQGMEGREAESVARGTPGVKQVVNLLAVPH